MRYIFAYGSNMHTERIRARAASATPVTTGYVTRRRLAFHKRGQDGSAKADAAWTDSESDRVWGVVYSLDEEGKLRLDARERGYDSQPVAVLGADGSVAASIYVAQPAAIDASLKPFVWYHRLVIQGAIEHALPAEYLAQLQIVESITDPDRARHRLHAQFLGE